MKYTELAEENQLLDLICCKISAFRHCKWPNAKKRGVISLKPACVSIDMLKTCLL